MLLMARAFEELTLSSYVMRAYEGAGPAYAKFETTERTPDLRRTAELAAEPLVRYGNDRRHWAALTRLESEVDEHRLAIEKVTQGLGFASMLANMLKPLFSDPGRALVLADDINRAASAPPRTEPYVVSDEAGPALSDLGHRISRIASSFSPASPQGFGPLAAAAATRRGVLALGAGAGITASAWRGQGDGFEGLVGLAASLMLLRRVVALSVVKIPLPATG